MKSDKSEDFFCFDCQQALLKYENEDVEYEDD